MENHETSPGPCVVCGTMNYPLSMGGPTICPKCDCGHFDAATVEQQAKVIARLRGENERLLAVLRAIMQLGGRHDLPDAWTLARAALDNQQHSDDPAHDGAGRER